MLRIFLAAAVVQLAAAEPALKTDAGDILFTVEKGKRVGYKVGEDDTVMFNDLPVELRDHADASVYAMKIGYMLGKKEAGASEVLKYLQGTVDGRVKTIEGQISGIAKSTSASIGSSEAKVDKKLEEVAALVAANEKKTKESLASSEAKVKKQGDAGQKALKDKVEAMYPTFMKVKCANEGLHFDVKSVACCKSGLVYDAKAGKCDKPKLGMLKGSPGESCLHLLQSKIPKTKDMNYWIDPNGGNTNDAIKVLCDFDTDGGGWTMVSSNSVRDCTFPKGTSRCQWFLEKPGHNGEGKASIDKDYLIGPQMNNLKYTWGRIMSKEGFNGAGANDVIDFKWPQNNHKTGAGQNGFNGSGRQVKTIGKSNAKNIGCGSCRYAFLDAQRRELDSGGCNSNSNQRTIGGACTSQGDPSRGCLVGHGSRESSHCGEGSYYQPSGRGCGSYDLKTYTTWVR